MLKIKGEFFKFIPSGSAVKNQPAKQEMQFWSLGHEDPLEKERAAHSGILAWEILWIEEPGGLQYMGSQRVRYNWGTKEQQQKIQTLKETVWSTIKWNMKIPK